MLGMFRRRRPGDPRARSDAFSLLFDRGWRHAESRLGFRAGRLRADIVIAIVDSMIDVVVTVHMYVRR